MKRVVLESADGFEPISEILRSLELEILALRELGARLFAKLRLFGPAAEPDRFL